MNSKVAEVNALREQMMQAARAIIWTWRYTRSSAPKSSLSAAR